MVKHKLEMTGMTGMTGLTGIVYPFTHGKKSGFICHTCHTSLIEGFPRNLNTLKW